MTTRFKKLSKLVLAPALLFAVLAMPTSQAFAAKSCGGVVTSVIDCTSSGDNAVTSLLLVVINFLAVGVGIAVVGGVVWGGLIYASSNGDAGKVKEAKTIIVNAVIGLLLFFFMYALINFLVPGGLFT